MQAPSGAMFGRIEEEESRNLSVPVEDNCTSYTDPGGTNKYIGAQWRAVPYGLRIYANGRHGSSRLVDARHITRAGGVVRSSLDCQVDTWSFGITLGVLESLQLLEHFLNEFLQTPELLEGRNIFNPIDTVYNHYVLPLALAQYIGYMGLPPLWMIQQSENPVIKTFFEEKGLFNKGVGFPVRT